MSNPINVNKIFGTYFLLLSDSIYGSVCRKFLYIFDRSLKNKRITFKAVINKIRYSINSLCIFLLYVTGNYLEIIARFTKRLNGELKLNKSLVLRFPSFAQL